MEYVEKIHKDIASCQTLAELEALRVKYLGKKGDITLKLKGIGELASSERGEYAKKYHGYKEEFTNSFQAKVLKLQQDEIDAIVQKSRIDTTLPAFFGANHHVHILHQITNDISDFFIQRGYYIADGPEIEDEIHNFEKLNIPKDNPVREMQDSLYINADLLMRTHTSPVQIREMIKHQGAVKLLCPGNVFRRDEDDATHSHQFMQAEGLVIGKNISMGHLKATLNDLAKFLFGEQTKIMMRPSYFPFTEPSVEVDVTCFKCRGEGCNLCKQSGWIEILGAGMVHEHVLTACGIDHEEYSGFAFGLGIDRIAMLKYGIDNIRLFYVNDLKFNRQFTSGYEGF